MSGILDVSGAYFLAMAPFFIFLIITIVGLDPPSGIIYQDVIQLPKIIDTWTRSETARFIDANNIFDYMNGAGELYLGYRFDHMEVFEYTSDDQADILVELYYMDTSDDAYGLLSLDWGGETIELSLPALEAATVAPPGRALYGAGLLRLCSDNVYVRILAYRETPESREAVMTIARAIVAGRDNTQEPEMVKKLVSPIDSEWQVRRDRIVFFRSFQVLNSLYYLSHQNLLNLDHSAEIVFAPYEKMPGNGDLVRVHYLHVKYMDADIARQGLEKFHTAYLPDHTLESTEFQQPGVTRFYLIEDGWIGYHLNKNELGIVFGCPDITTGQTILQALHTD